MQGQRGGRTGAGRTHPPPGTGDVEIQEPSSRREVLQHSRKSYIRTLTCSPVRLTDCPAVIVFAPPPLATVASVHTYLARARSSTHSFAYRIARFRFKATPPTSPLSHSLPLPLR